ncbi:MAG: AtpZ/AtpI family protein [Rhodospirillales bacterium]
MNEGEAPKSPEKPKPLEDFEARLREAKAEIQPAAPNGPAKETITGLGAALRIGTELVAALVVGVGIGYMLDNWLETAPWFLVLFFFLGAAAGILNVYRAASSIGLTETDVKQDKNYGED